MQILYTTGSHGCLGNEWLLRASEITILISIEPILFSTWSKRERRQATDAQNLKLKN
jgi:hypothetical protein